MILFTGGVLVNLQTTLAAANPPVDPAPEPHHPVTCLGELWLDEDGRLGCAHVSVEPDDPRTRGCIDQSVAILLLELAVERERGESMLAETINTGGGLVGLLIIILIVVAIVWFVRRI